MSDIVIPTLPLDRFLHTGEALHVAADGQMQFAATGCCPRSPILFPGSFNPIHQGHWDLARIAEQMLGEPVAFEMSVRNVDKPTMTAAEIRARLRPFNWQASVWLTHAPRFVDKAAIFPGATFVVGADTALRIVSPRYYEDDAERMLARLAEIAERGCRFLVACRVDARQQCIGLRDLPIPGTFRSLFDEIPAERFRWDVSSTELRTRGDPISSLAGP